jgi:integrase
MCVRKKFHRKTGEFLGWEAYVHLYSVETKNQIHRYKLCKTEDAAKRAEKILIRTAAEELKALDDRGSHWSVLLDKWEIEARQLGRNPATLKAMTPTSIANTVSLLKTWTKDWLEKPCNELSIKDGKDLLLLTESEDLAASTIRKLKTYVNLVFRYGMQEGVIKDLKKSPVHGVMFEIDEGDTLPEILSVEEVQKLLIEAKARNHPWYRIWAVALMTGMRSSELYALQKKNVMLEQGLIRVSESWDWYNNCAKSTKSGYWRTAPIATAIRPIIEELMAANPDSPFLFPRMREWERSEQAMVLRKFCSEIGITSVRFHTLRACFATHLLAMGVDQATIMAIGGWSNLKTFKIYVRLSGITERSKTEGLGSLIVPSEKTLAEHISKAYVPPQAA